MYPDLLCKVVIVLFKIFASCYFWSFLYKVFMFQRLYYFRGLCSSDNKWQDHSWWNTDIMLCWFSSWFGSLYHDTHAKVCRGIALAIRRWYWISYVCQCCKRIGIIASARWSSFQIIFSSTQQNRFKKKFLSWKITEIQGCMFEIINFQNKNNEIASASIYWLDFLGFVVQIIINIFEFY